ncbi:collagen-like protein [Streptomyces sp. NPDC056652]|uniref:collagen-like triple helix repeat-containing protein n=1 Tax=Streptomyces sp. NPDC056652 TaxID=3345893 RepID=UPI0036869A66
MVFTGRGIFSFDTQGRLVDTDGAVGVRLLPNDVEGANPTGWVWMVTETITGAPPRLYFIKLSTTQTEVDLAAIQEVDPSRANYVPVPGPEGPSGLPGVDGADGAPGTPGAAGEAGPQGASAYDVWLSLGNTGSEADFVAALRGPAGVNGTDGAPGPVRPGLIATVGQPADATGIDGDWAVDAGAKRLYGPKTDGAWEPWLHVPAPTEPGWHLNGFAALTGTDLYLTHATDGFGAGACWRAGTESAEGLDVTFVVEMSGGTGADGVCFALASLETPATYLGGGGGDLGLVGCDAVALALDTGAGSRARLVTTAVAGGMTTVATYGGVLDLRAAPVLVRVRYGGGVFTAWVDGAQVVSAAVASPGTVRPGWTGANGGLVDDHIVREVTFVPRGGVQL